MSGDHLTGNEADGGLGGNGGSAFVRTSSGNATGGGLYVATGTTVLGGGTTISGNSVVAGAGRSSGTASFPDIAANSPGFGNYTLVPAVTASSFVFNTAPLTLNFTFTENVSASLSAADLVVQLAGGGSVSPISYAGYNASTNTASFTLPTNLAYGNYTAHFVSGGVTDASNNPLLPGFSFNFFVLSADANHDGKVNAEDFAALASHY